MRRKIIGSGNRVIRIPALYALMGLLPWSILSLQAAATYTDSFEGTSLNSFWTVSGPGTATLTNSIAHTGNQSLKLTASSTFPWNVNVTHDLGAAESGSVSVWVQGQQLCCSAGAGLELDAPDGSFALIQQSGNINCNSCFAARVGTASGQISIPFNADASSWHLFQIDVGAAGATLMFDGAVMYTSPSFTAFRYINLQVWAGPGGTAYFDDFSFAAEEPVNVFPTEATNSGPVNVVFQGVSGAPPGTSPSLVGAQVELSGAGLPVIAGTNVVNPSPDVLTATFDLTGSMPGPRDIVIIPQSGAPVTLSGAFSILPTPGCSYTVAPLNPSFPASGGSGAIVVTSNVTTSACNFHSFDAFPTNVPWITALPVPHIAIGGTGFPGEALRYQVAPNPTASSRSTTVSIYGQSVTISQTGTGACSYSLSPLNEISPVSGGSFSVDVVTAADCGWSASSGLSWVHIIAGSAGTGNGTVTIQVDPNTGGLRSGNITIAGIPFNVSQGASACGAFDVSSQLAVLPKPIVPVPDFIGDSYLQTITLLNRGTTTIAGPIYLVLDGLPVTGIQCGTDPLGGYQTCSVTQATSLTFCQSPSGSDMVPFSSTGLAPGQEVSGNLNFVPGPAGGAVTPRYTTRVLSGTPNK